MCQTMERLFDQKLLAMPKEVCTCSTHVGVVTMSVWVLCTVGSSGGSHGEGEEGEGSAQEDPRPCRCASLHTDAGGWPSWFPPHHTSSSHQWVPYRSNTSGAGGGDQQYQHYY